jgi:MFS family permease
MVSLRNRTGSALQQSESRYVTGVAAFFATMYFVQGIGDPTSGLIAQPVRALLKSWDTSAGTIGGVMALLAVPWMIKPLFALLSDYVPLFGSHRRNYLLLSSAAAALGLFVVWLMPLPRGALAALLLWLLLPTVGIAFGDVLVDALMVEVGQPRGLTGRLQSIQWAAVYLAMLLAGVVGGWISSVGRYEIAFGLCAALWGCSFLLAWRYAKDTPRPPQQEGLGGTSRDLVAALRVPGLPTVAAFLFLWSFNPSWVSVQYLHITVALALGEQAYGNSFAWFAAGSVIACAGYGVYCRAWPMGRLVHLAIVTGIVGYAVFIHITSATSLYAVALIAGVANMTGNLIQLDLAARLVPVPVAATCFAVLMALTNIASSSSEALGANLYEWLGPRIGVEHAYQVVVSLSALCAASCWLLVPGLKRAVPRWWSG